VHTSTGAALHQPTIHPKGVWFYRPPIQLATPPQRTAVRPCVSGVATVKTTVMQTETHMITIFKTLPDGLTVVDRLVAGSWVHVVDPDRDETARLQDECGIPEAFITASLDADELARVDQEQDMLLITFLMPHEYSNDPSEVPYSTTPLGIILTADHLFTVSKMPPPFLSDLTKRYGKQLATAKRHRLILLLFLAVAHSYLLVLTPARKSNGRHPMESTALLTEQRVAGTLALPEESSVFRDQSGVE
jgi:CorA-like Mg2+ transporter protein